MIVSSFVALSVQFGVIVESVCTMEKICDICGNTIERNQGYTFWTGTKNGIHHTKVYAHYQVDGVCDTTSRIVHTHTSNRVNPGGSYVARRKRYG